MIGRQFIRNSSLGFSSRTFSRSGVHPTRHKRALVVSDFLLLSILLLGLRFSRAENPANSYRLTINPSYTFTNGITAFAHLGSSYNEDKDNRVSNIISPGLHYSAAHWLQIWGGFNDRYTVSEQSADQFEIRPYLGLKFFIPNDWDIHLYNFVRYEYRATRRFDAGWSDTHRIRGRFGLELPLAWPPNAWQPRTAYFLASVEPFFRFDHHQIDPLRVAGGLGYIVNRRLEVEFIYYALFSRPRGASLEFTDNIFRLNFKIDLTRKPKFRAADDATF